MFSGGYRSQKLRTHLRLAINRLKLMEKKKSKWDFSVSPTETILGMSIKTRALFDWGGGGGEGTGRRGGCRLSWTPIL